MTKFRAFLVHFLLSTTIFVSVILLVAFAWYPSIYLEASGVWMALRMVALVDVGLGPLMTLILFRKNKPGLKFDLSVVACVQVIALCYGVWVLYSQKPVLTVFHDGFYICLDQSQVDYSGVKLDRFDDGRFVVPIAILPKLSEQQSKEWHARQALLPEGYPKHPAFVYGESLVEYNPATLPMVLEDEWDLSRQLELSAEDKAIWLEYQNEFGTDSGHAYFVFTCGKHQYMTVMNPKSGELEATLDISFLNARQKRLIKP
ncbi:hypothetical protein [Motiliproteus sp. MSK22-1]|uniref:hypothetical protein n=1 Tax=Motiliproteus sp. MSK22-1 TaxID=1897630 RepID=UPI0009758C1E|nr:hypothetical protein [Motiliproteus sp. MSK22-1]OMH35306.1 hypothetical protein BGP75_10525 [Motiliproteus sp. MSK22-1]